MAPRITSRTKISRQSLRGLENFDGTFEDLFVDSCVKSTNVEFCITCILKVVKHCALVTATGVQLSIVAV